MTLYLIRLDISPAQMTAIIVLAEKRNCTADQIIQAAIDNYVDPCEPAPWCRTGGLMGPIVEAANG